jgi:hypothetical protein
VSLSRFGECDVVGTPWSSSDVVPTTDSPANISNGETSQAVTTVIETGDLHRLLNSALEVRGIKRREGKGSRGVQQVSPEAW